MEPRDVRAPAVAGHFYSRNAQTLADEVDECLAADLMPARTIVDAIGCVVPHAGYMYSGRVAGAVYQRLAPRSRYLILGPNHRGEGWPLALMSKGTWLTPFGEVLIDSELAQTLQGKCHLLADDPRAHSHEHSLEVQLPFLQRRGVNFTFVPIALSGVDYFSLDLLGSALAETVRSSAAPILIIASSDMNHYEPDDVTREKDRKAIDRILRIDPAGLLEVIRREDISMCGYAPTIAMLIAAQRLGARQAEVIKYATSADSGGDSDSVVGYAGIVVS